MKISSFDPFALTRSLLTVENPFNSTDEIISWVARRNHEVSVSVEPVPFADLGGWRFDARTGDLCHQTGRFFSIVGLDVYVDNGRVQRWMQPIINQPEVGILGILAKEIDGVLYFLLQAKIEPGNVNCVQLAPTLQATRSNYMRVHGGKSPAYLEEFLTCRPEQVLLDQLQSEQGARFLRKRNRNLIVLVDGNVPVRDDFRWLTLAQIKTLMRVDNLINMDTRTVLSGLRFKMIPQKSLVDGIGDELFVSEQVLEGVWSTDEILHWMSALKSRYELLATRIPLRKVEGWCISGDEIVRPDRKFFRVLGVNVTIANREIASWCQPIVQPMQEGLSVLFASRRNGVLHFLLQAKIECGNFDVIELAPTIQCLTGDYRTELPELRPHFVMDFVEGRIPGRALSDTMQSEEGGRFYHEQNRNVVWLLPDDIEMDVPERFAWLTLGQIKEFLRFNNYLNIQVRSLISALDYGNGVT